MDEQEAMMTSHVAEASNAAANAEEARQKAFQASLVKALHEVLVDGDDEARPILIKRIPFICKDVAQIKGDLSWIKWLVIGMATGIGAIFATILASFLTAPK